MQREVTQGAGANERAARPDRGGRLSEPRTRVRVGTATLARVARAAAAIVPYLLAAAVLFWATMRIPYNVREHDIGSHLVYIQLIEEKHTIPRADTCWECHQPPLYYVLATELLKITASARPPEHPRAGVIYPGARVLQRFGAVLGLGTLTFWLLTIRLVLARAYDRFMASAIVTFWPTLAIHTTRIGNESLFYLFAAASLWSLVAWRRSGRPLALVAAVLAAGLAVNTKINGVVPGLVVVVSLAMTMARPRLRERWWARGVVPGVVAVALVAALSVFALAHWKQWTVSLPNFHAMGDNLMVPGTWRAFAQLTPSSFSKDPFVHIGGGEGRDEFWNYLFRSSLFGQFASEDPVTRTFAYGLAGLVAAFLPFVLAGFVASVSRCLRRDDVGHREMVMTVLGFVGFLVTLRYRFPWAPHNDFRFILPIVAPCAIMAASAIGWVHRKLRRRWPHLAALPAWMVVAFCIAATRIATSWP